MTPVGHTIVGLTIGAIACDRYPALRGKVVALFVCALAANAPDLPFPMWGHDRYDISHSVVSLLLLIAAVIAIALFARPLSTEHRPLIVGASLSLLSHLLLDSFYSHGKGVRILWPMDDDFRLALPLPWFELSGWNGFPPSRAVLKVFLIEAVVYGALGVAAIALCRLLHRSNGGRNA